MAITDKEQGVWNLEEVYNKINQGGIWSYDGIKEGYLWGGNGNGALGLNNTTSYSSPKQLPGSWDRIQARIGIKNDGTAWAWGYNAQRGELGQNNLTNYSSPMQIGTETNWSFIGMSPVSSYGLKTDGTLWTWGYNENGSLGLNQNDVHRSSPTQIPGTTWSSINIGDTDNSGHAIATKTDGTLWMWGYNQGSGELGQNNRTNQSSPVQIPGTTWATTYTSASVSAAGGSYAIKTDGTLWAWGSTNANLGHNNATNYSSPAQVGTDTTWRSILGQPSAPGVRQAFATKTDGSMWSWGSGTYGGLGQGNTSPYNSPKQIGTDTNWSSQTYGINSKGGGIFVKTDGTLWSWGQNAQGNLGHNNKTNYSSPKQIGTGTSWTRSGFLGEQNGSATVLQ